MIQLTLNEMLNKENESNKKFGRALREGFFYIEIPESIKEKIAKVVQYAEGIRDNKSLKTANLGDPPLGYQERFGTQAVAFSS